MRTPLRRNNSSTHNRGARKSSAEPGNTNHRRTHVNYREMHQKYMTLAREAISAGNLIEAEQYYQHAEHYYRQVTEQITNQPVIQSAPAAQLSPQQVPVQQPQQ